MFQKRNEMLVSMLTDVIEFGAKYALKIAEKNMFAEKRWSTLNIFDSFNA